MLICCVRIEAFKRMHVKDAHGLHQRSSLNPRMYRSTHHFHKVQPYAIIQQLNEALADIFAHCIPLSKTIEVVPTSFPPTSLRIHGDRRRACLGHLLHCMELSLLLTTIFVHWDGTGKSISTIITCIELARQDIVGWEICASSLRASSCNACKSSCHLHQTVSSTISADTVAS